MFSPESSRVKTPQADGNIPINFIGKILREAPTSIEGMELKDRYILFVRSDYVNRPTYKELREVFGIPEKRAREIYRKGIKDVWEQSGSEIQKSYPLAVIYDTARKPSLQTRARISAGKKGKKPSDETRARMGEAQIRRFQDPKERVWQIKHLKDMQEANRGTHHSSETRHKMIETRARNLGIDFDDFGLWRYAQEHQLGKAIVKRGFLTQTELKILSKYFKTGKKPINFSDLLDRLSLGVANLA